MTHRRTGHVAAVAFATAVALIMVTPGAAYATDPIVPGNEGDVGVYTAGTSHAMDIGDPTYTNEAVVAAALEPGVAWNPGGSMFSDIFQNDLAQIDASIAAGTAPFYLDRVLGYRGNNSGLNILQTRGRSLYMRGSSTTNFTTMGFAGTAAGGGNTSFGNLYTITVTGKTVAENSAATNRFNAPSYMSDKYNLTQSSQTTLTADLKKFITYNNVAVTTITFNNPGTTDATITVRATSTNALTAVEGKTDEMRGTVTMTGSGGNLNGTTTWGTGTVAVTVPGSTKNGNYLDKSITIPAGGSVDYMAVGGYWHSAIPESEVEFYDYAAMTPADAFKAGTTDFNRRWASDIPYIDVPSAAVEKAILYRWWLERYDSLDAGVDGYVYQYPTTIEGVNLYYNSVVLTQPMHLQDTKWIRNPYLAYGQIMNVGELSGSSAFLDSPGHGSWNNHYSQYIGTAGLEAYAVHGGGTEIAERFATYFEGDGVGQLEHYDGNGNYLIAYTANYMPGNDADALTFGYSKSGTATAGSNNIERPESAYVWGDFDAAAQLYEIAGAPQAKVDEMADMADTIKDAILDNLWSPTMGMFVATTTRGRTAATSMNSNANPLAATEPTHIPARESNLYDVYAQNLIDPADAATYEDGFRFLTYGDNFPIFPFYTANQYDKTRYNIGGSNNFSNINFTVQYRGVRSALRYYDPTQKYITNEYAARLLDWMAWSIYLSGGDLLMANQAEYYSGWNATTKSYSRNNPYHVALGNMNYIYVEDMGGLLPRTDDVIELWPIDLGYAYFMVNNVRYHNHDLTIVWDEDGTRYGQGAGYSLWVDGVKKVTSDKLTHLQYDPNAGTVTHITTGAQTDPTATVAVVDPTAVTFPEAVDTVIDDQRVVEYMKTAGIYLDRTDTPNLALDATVTSSTMQTTIPTSSRRAFHTPGSSTSAMNYDPGSISDQERPASLAAVNDGSTVNEPYWGNYGVSDQSGYVELDFGTAKTFDNVEIYFHDAVGLDGGAKVPLSYYVAVPDAGSATGWKAIAGQAHNPKLPGMKQNDVLFNDVTASKVRVYFTNNPGYYTAIAEIQVFDADQVVPVVVNDPPTVTVAVNTAQNGNLSTQLTATVTDDGIPFDQELTFGWTVVSKPAGASVVFADASATTTRVNGTVQGSYTFEFAASDGELTTTRQVTATLEPKTTGNEWGASAAAITTNYTASWENHNMVNAASNPTSSNPGTGQGWGNWSNGASSSNPAWIQYRWDEPISITSTQIYWYSDGGGTRVPTAAGYTIQYSMDGTTWTNVTLTNGSTYAAGIQTGRYNVFEIEPVTAKYLRIRITAITSSAAGTGVLRWRVYGPGVETVEPPIKHRTAVGVIPTLPATHGVTFTDGSRGELVFEWADITADDVAEANTDPFSVWGVNTTFDVMAEAQIYVRPGDQQVVISSIDPMAQTVFLGTEPDLPENLSVFFNDGSADNDCIGVTWDYDPAVVNTVGVYHIPGHYTLPDWISETNQPDVFFDLTVEGPEVLSVDVTPVAPTVVAGNTQQFTEDVDTTYDADDSVTWTVEGAESFITAIDATGLLSVGTDETATTLVVKATSVFDPTKVGTATVTVTPAPPDDALAAALAQAKALLPAADSYTVSSWTGFPQTVDDADAVCYVVTGTTGPCDTADPPVSAADKWAAIADLHDAIAGLVPRGDPSSLGTVVDILGNLDLSAYTEDSQEALQDAIEAIENLLAQNPADVSQEQVDQVKQQLADAIAGLELEITPSTSLETVLDAVSAMDLSGFTPESAQALEEALADAQAVLDSNPTQAEVDAAMQAVADALAGLVPAVDKSALVSLIDANAAIYAAGNGAAIYTDASWAVFAAAIEAASDEYDSTTSTTQSVADAYAILVAAVAGLVEIGQVVPGTVTISGTVKVGQTVTVAPGTWTPADAQLSYQWKLDGTDIAGAVTTSYAIKAGDEGKTLTVAVTGIKADHVDGSTTSAGVLIGLGDLTAGTPTISGTVKVGQSVTATPGTWGPSGVALGYQWKLGGTAISGAVTSTYAIKAADAGKTLTVTVTGSKAGYAAASATSAGQVVAAAPTPTATPTPSKSATPTPTAAATKTATPTPAGPKAYVPKYQSFVLSPDLAADGRGEILAVTTAGALEIHSANAAGGIASSKTVFSSGFAGTKVYGPGDWNGDGKADVVAVDKSGYMWLYAGDGKGGLAAKKEIGHGWTPFRIIPAGDLNQDGANDLLAIDASGKLWLYAGNGKGGFKGSPTQVGQGWNGIDLYAAGDLNGDGKNDILALLPDSTLWAYSGRGNGTFATPTQVGRGWGQFELAAGADLNGDRRADIVGRNNSTGELFYYQGNGGGSFQAAKKIASGW